MSLSTLEFLVISWVFVHFKWRLFTTYLRVSSPSKWHDSYFHKHLLISSPLCFSFLFLTPFFLTFTHLCLAFFIILCLFSCLLFLHLHHHNHHTCIFSLPSRSAPSHLLNHLVKFVSNENLLCAYHHNC